MKKASHPASTATPCLICGYDLTGLSAEGVCPECAVPTGPSIRRNLFELTGVDYGERVLRGLRLARDAAWGGLIAIAATIAGSWMDVQILSLLGIGLIVAAPMFAFGWWLVTRLPRGTPPPQGLLAPTLWVRIAVLAVPIAFIALMAAFTGRVPVATGVPAVLFPVLSVALLAVVVSRIIVTSEWIARLSEHVGDDRTPKQVRRRVRLAPILVVLFIILLSGAALLRDFASEGSVTASVAIGVSITIMAAGFATYACLYIGLIHTCHRTVRAALAAASLDTDEPVAFQPTYRAGH